jgi:hypothetical protein
MCITFGLSNRRAYQNSQRHFRKGLARCALLLLAVAIVTTAADAAETLTAIKAEGNTELAFKSRSGNNLLVEMWQARFNPSFPYKGALFWGGDIDQLPGTFLSSIQIVQNKKSVFIPLSAYSDLGDVKFASLEASQDGFILHLHGGNTATEYDAEINFQHGYLRTRSVALRELPDERREMTSYSFPK